MKCKLIISELVIKDAELKSEAKFPDLLCRWLKL